MQSRACYSVSLSFSSLFSEEIIEKIQVVISKHSVKHNKCASSLFQMKDNNDDEDIRDVDKPSLLSRLTLSFS